MTTSYHLRGTVLGVICACELAHSLAKIENVTHRDLRSLTVGLVNTLRSPTTLPDPNQFGILLLVPS